MPQVQERLAQEFPSLELKQQDPNQIVAKGAAIFGLKMVLEDKAIEIINERAPAGKTVDNMDSVSESARASAYAKAGESYGLASNAAIELGTQTVGNVTSRSFGLQVYVERLKAMRIANLVHVDDSVPLNVTKTFGTMENSQTSVNIVIFENEMRTTDSENLVEELSCKRLAEASLDLAGPYPKGSPIDVSFRLSPDGLLDILARHTDTGKEVEVHLKVEGAMSAEEVAKSKSHVAGLAVC
jgi:molecular chaperone DnaK (HSP70)